MIRWIRSLFFENRPASPAARRSYRLDAPDRLLEKLRALDKGTGAYARNAYYMNEFGVSDRTIRRWLNVLVERGDIRITGKGKGRRIHVIASPGLTLKPQKSLMNKGSSEIQMRSDCPENVRDVTGQCPGNVRGKYRSYDRTILKSKYETSEKAGENLKAWRRSQVESLSEDDLRRMLG